MLAALAPHGYVRQGGAKGAAWQFVPVLAPSTEVRAAALESCAPQRHRDADLLLRAAAPDARLRVDAASPASLRYTDELAARVLSLPMANDLSTSDMDAIVACLVAAAQSPRDVDR